MIENENEGEDEETKEKIETRHRILEEPDTKKSNRKSRDVMNH